MEKTTLPLNQLSGRPKRQPSAATVAKLANKFDDSNNSAGIEQLDDTVVSLLVRPNWNKGFLADKAGKKYTYHIERKFEIGDEAAIKRPTDNAPLLIARTTLVYATPEYAESKAQTAEVKRWRNLASAIGKGLADVSGKGLTVADCQAWMDGTANKQWLFKNYSGDGVQFCSEDTKGAVEFAQVPLIQQTAIQRHFASAMKRAEGAATGGDTEPVLDINTKIAQLEKMLADKYSDEALRKIEDIDYRTHMIDWRTGKKRELGRLKAKRDKDAKAAAAQK